MKTKTVYRIDNHNTYCGRITLDESDLSPLEPDVWLIPAGCVEVPPPEIPEGQLAVYNGKGWDLVDAPAPQPEPQPGPELDQLLPGEVRAYLTSVVQEHMDTTARERNYDGILSLCTYATSTNPKFAAEGQAGVEWRDDVWTRCYELLDQVEAGDVTVPTASELIGMLPPFTWPDLAG